MMNSAEQYRQEWAVKPGRPASEVYVPEALREESEPTIGESYEFTTDDVDEIK